MENPDYYMPYQYGNQSNPNAHYSTTGPEIVKDLPSVDVFVAGLGTGGTLMGVGKCLKEYNPEIKIGEKYIDFEALDREGNTTKLSKFFNNGKYVLLDFPTFLGWGWGVGARAW